MANPKPSHGRDRPATVHDVARVAGVSAQTVSRLVKGYEGIRPATRQKVEAAIEELGYRTNQAARLLRTRRSNRIGAIVHQMFEPGPTQLLRGAAIGAREAGYSLNIVGVDGLDEAAIEEAFMSFEEEQVAGVLAVTLTDSVRAVVERRPLDVPIVVDPVENESFAPTTNESGAALVAGHLLELGHRRFGLINGPGAWVPSRQRRERFVADVGAAGATIVTEWEGDWSPEAGDRAGAEFDRGSGITAVFAANDRMALGFMHRLAARGIDIPGDVSVVGFDDIPEASYLSPPLTTVRADFESEGRTAIEALLADIERRPRPALSHPTGELVVRSSTAVTR